MPRKIFLAIFGVLSLATFFAPADWSNDFFAPFNLIRLLVILTFLLLLFTSKFRDNLSRSVKTAPKSAQILMIAVPLIVLICVMIQALWPEFAVWLVRDETRGWSFRHAIFIKSALQLIACAIFISLAIKFAKSKKLLPVIICVGLSLVLIAMAGEELSWGQRIFDFATPSSFAGNAQGETNLHNFATDVFQNTLYFGGFLLLVALPFFRETLQKFLAKSRKLKFLGDFLPPTYFVLIFAAAYGLVDPIAAPGGVHFGSILFSILATLAILIYSVIRAREHLAERICLTLGVFLIALFFNLFVSEVWNINPGVPTEYLEIFISFGIFLWALTLRRSPTIRQRHH
jgi:hypothetical protein